MSESQRHGFEFERLVRQAAQRMAQDNGAAQSPSASGLPPPAYTARFDIPPEHDPAGQGIPTCVKIAKRSANGRVRVDMADARRALALGDQPMTRLVVGVFEQDGDTKRVEEVREYLISASTWKSACGGVPMEAIEQFHRGLAEGTPEQARRFARDRKTELAGAYPSALKWSPKIDSKKQRRLQCSIYLDDLDRVVSASADPNHVHGPGDPLWGMDLPLEIPSPARARRKRSAACVGQDAE